MVFILTFMAPLMKFIILSLFGIQECPVILLMTSMFVRKLWLPNFSKSGINIIILGKLFLIKVQKIAFGNKEHTKSRK